MSSVIIEREREQDQCSGRLNLIPIMDAVADAVRLLGHEVVRWHRSEPLPIVEGATHVFWWGCNILPEQQARANRLGLSTVYMEIGWTKERKDYLQMDHLGTGGNASWVDEPPEYIPQGPLPLKPDGDLLVCLRYDGAKIATDRNLSPYLSGNLHWIDLLVHTSTLPLRVRAHYASQRKRTNLLFMKYHKRITRDCHGTFEDAMRDAKAVAVIDSTCGAQAMEAGLPVLCYGRQVFRQPGAVYCLDADPDKSRKAITELSDGRCSLDRGAVEAMLKKIWDHQWWIWNTEALARKIHGRFHL